MKRAGFTMIELIFVIVILGILASVAVPKLIGVKESADEGLIKGFVGTLNRTVAASKWSQSLMNGLDGSVTDGNYNITIADTEFPSSFTLNTINMTQCFDANITNVAQSDVALSTTDGNYHILCRDGSSSAAPKFWYKTVDIGVAVDVNGTGLKAN